VHQRLSNLRHRVNPWSSVSLAKEGGTGQIALKGLASFACPRGTKGIELRGIEELRGTQS
jgi:hypothetical protein